jgi:ParB-like chromosome segregation protein Spo0J
MDIIAVPISDLTNDPANVRRHSARNLEAIKASLLRFGQQVPLVVDGQNVVRVGNARLEAMRQLGWTEAKVIRTELTGPDLIAYAIADNRTGDPDVGSTFDHDALIEMLTALKAEDESLTDAAGFTAEELVAYLEEQGTAGEPDAPEDFPEVDEDIHCDYRCPKCSYSWSGKAVA